MFPRDPTAPGNAGGALHPTHLAQRPEDMRVGQLADANRTLVNCRSWTVPEWNTFKIRFKKVVETAWNNQMLLLPPEEGAGDGGLSDADYRQLIGDPRIRAHVECALAIQLVATNEAAHAEIEVVHLAQPGLVFRNWMHRIDDTSVDITVRNKDRWQSTSFFQFVAAHEVGHWLHDLNKKHFDHVDVAAARKLPAAQRGDAQYGTVLGKRQAIMGSGSLFTEHEAQPWLGRVRRHTGALYGWTMIHRVRFRHEQELLSPRQKQLMASQHP